MCSSSSVAVSEVSGGTAALPTCWLVLHTLSGLCDPPGDHQRETWRPVTDRHPENQETAVRTPTAMMLPVTTALSSGCLDATHTLSPQQHVISTSHGNQGCTYMLNTTADEGKRRNHPVCLMIKKKQNKKTYLFHEEEWKSRRYWMNFDLWMLLCPNGNHLLAALAPECMWISGLDGSSILQKGYRISQKKKIQFLLRDWLLNFLSCSVPA